ncbi:Hypp9756 [Branchiostoma lanceolatum]|uniref:Hypp9756 protein n=1 Tax=Branchiostoma lanceolatum TaxID=7740 RepID=A0A8S4MPC4_BRALA|nr:Hypp9756 [Branchiostoma lanceolatum]
MSLGSKDMAPWEESLEEVGHKVTDQYLNAHDRSRAEGVRPRNSPSSGEGMPARKVAATVASGSLREVSTGRVTTATSQESHGNELEEVKRRVGKTESAVPQYDIPGRRKQGYRDVRCPPTADVKSRSVIGETIQKLTRKDPVSRRGRLRWLRRQQKLVGAAGRRARQQE